MIHPLRRWHRRLIALVVITLTVAAWFALMHRAPDVRLDRLPAALAPARIDGGVAAGALR